MSVRVNLPPGCSGFTTAEGGRIGAKPGGAVTLSDEHAARLARSQHAQIGLVTVGAPVQIGTKKGRWCAACSRLWQAWSQECPKCGGPTVPR